MLKPQLPTDVEGENFIGLGWFCAGKGDAFQCFHEGWDEGFVAGLWLYPAAGKGVAIMINSNQGEPPLSRKPHSFGQNRAGHRWVAAKRRHGRGGEMAHLETDRLLLREVRASDADDFLRYRQQEDYWRHVPIVPPTADSIAASVNGWIQSQDKNPRTAYNFAIIDKRSEEMVGYAGLFVRDLRSRQGEIGWGVISSHRGQGLGTEIGQALLRLAFDALNLHRGFAQCRVENQACRRINIMAKLGMREEGVLRENVFVRGEWWSSAQCSILSSEWDLAAKAK
jgi:ribosomal-protein-alanine N-acetyltransferase